QKQKRTQKTHPFYVSNTHKLHILIKSNTNNYKVLSLSFNTLVPNLQNKKSGLTFATETVVIHCYQTIFSYIEHLISLTKVTETSYANEKFIYMIASLQNKPPEIHRLQLFNCKFVLPRSARIHYFNPIKTVNIVQKNFKSHSLSRNMFKKFFNLGRNDKQTDT
ncbi:hypothetical protein OTU49_010882, partial [Cherax quadricarinatus]